MESPEQMPPTALVTPRPPTATAPAAAPPTSPRRPMHGHYGEPTITVLSPQKPPAAAAAAAEGSVASSAAGESIVQLDVGGREFAVSRHVLTGVEPNSRLAAMFSSPQYESLPRTASGRVFLDMNPDLFAVLLEYLRAKARTHTDQPTVPFPSVKGPLHTAFQQLLDHLGFKNEAHVQETEIFDAKNAGRNLLLMGHDRLVTPDPTLSDCVRFGVACGCAVYRIGMHPTWRLQIDCPNRVAENTPHTHTRSPSGTSTPTHMHAYDVHGNVHIGVEYEYTCVHHHEKQGKTWYGFDDHGGAWQGPNRFEMQLPPPKLQLSPHSTVVLRVLPRGILHLTVESGEGVDTRTHAHKPCYFFGGLPTQHGTGTLRLCVRVRGGGNSVRILPVGDLEEEGERDGSGQYGDVH